jgi:hypothetical protein
MGDRSKSFREAASRAKTVGDLEKEYGAARRRAAGSAVGRAARAAGPAGLAASLASEVQGELDAADKAAQRALGMPSGFLDEKGTYKCGGKVKKMASGGKVRGSGCCKRTKKCKMR